MARRNLATLWNGREPDVGEVIGEPLAVPELGGFQALAVLLDKTPELAQLAGEACIHEAQLRLARSDAKTDLHWQIGGRGIRGGDNDDVALVAGVNFAVGADRRAQPGIRAAEAQLAFSSIEQEALTVRLYSTLSTAYGTYTTARLKVRRLQEEVMPRLAKAEQAADRAWRAGAIGYLEWAMLQDRGSPSGGASCRPQRGARSPRALQRR